MHAGHRERMRTKLLDEESKLSDAEILEILLYDSIARRDTKPIAKLLLDAFINLKGVFSASPKFLMAITGVGQKVAEQIVVVGKILQQLQKPEELPLMNNFLKLKDFIQERFAGLVKERLEIFLINDEGRVFCIHTIEERATNDSVSIDYKQITKILSITAPESIILVHNHPSGSVQPSGNDDICFEEICSLCRKQGIRVLDSIIVAEDGLHSYYHAQSFQIHWKK